MTDRPGLFWGLIASMWLGNLMLVVLNLPMVGVWVRLLRVPYRLLYPAIIVFCCIGAYTINSKPFDAYVMAFFAIFGYVALKLDCEPAPLILGFVLGPMMEENLRRALLISRGDPMVFLQEPISLAFLLVAVGLAGGACRASDPRQARGGAEGVARSLRPSEQAGDPVPDHAFAISAKPEIGLAGGAAVGVEGDGCSERAAPVRGEAGAGAAPAAARAGCPAPSLSFRRLAN